MADDFSQKVISQILTILNRMDDERRANTLEQISKHMKELNNDLKIEETSIKTYQRKVNNNHNGCKRALPETFMNTVVANLLKNISEISVQSNPGDCENKWISLMIKKSSITPQLCSSSSSVNPKILKTIDPKDDNLQDAPNRLLTVLSQLDKGKRDKILKQISKHTKEFEKSLAAEKAKTKELIKQLSNSHTLTKQALPETLLNALMKGVSYEVSVQSNPGDCKSQGTILKIKKSSIT